MTRKLSLKDVVAELVGPATIRRQALDIKGPSPSPFGAFRLRVHSKDMTGGGQGTPVAEEGVEATISDVTDCRREPRGRRWFTGLSPRREPNSAVLVFDEQTLCPEAVPNLCVLWRH